jgi:hypothetical protein
MSVNPEIDVVVENRSSHVLENVRARFGEFGTSWGLVSTGATKIVGQYPHAITPESELHWDVGGRHKQQTFDLRKIGPPRTPGRLVFTIYEERAAVEFRENSPQK